MANQVPVVKMLSMDRWSIYRLEDYAADPMDAYAIRAEQDQVEQEEKHY